LRITGFIWLEQYVEKLAWKHEVLPEEVEALFESGPQYRLVEKGHVAGENMYAAMGQGTSSSFSSTNTMAAP
jgi:hypothetical protein